MDSPKKQILDQLEIDNGVVSVACRNTGTPRSTFYKWLKEDADFKRAVDEIQEVTLDTVESALFNRIKNGDTTAMIFYLKTRGKRRGYIERQEVTGADGSGIAVMMKPVYEVKELKSVEAN